MSRRQPDLFDRLVALDRALGEHGFPPLSPFWRDALRRFLRGDRRWLVARVGRRGGKGLTAAKLAVLFALYAPFTPVPGELAFVIFASVDKDEAGQRVRMVRAMLDALGVPHTSRGGDIEIGSRAVAVRVAAASVAAVSGRKSLLFVGDEIAKWRDEQTGKNPAQEVIASAGPMLSTEPAARGLLLSSPWTSTDYHATRFDEGESDRQTVVSAATWEANPTLSEEQTRREEPDPRVWAREYAARPVESVSAGVTADEYDACVSRGVQRRPRIDGGHHLATLDAAFRHDAFVVSVFHLELRDGPEGSMRECVVQDAIMHLQPRFLRPVRFDDAVQRTADLLREYGITRIYGDAHGSDALRPALAERGITLDVLSSSSPSITARIETFLMRVANARFEFLEHDAQRREVLESILTHHSGGRVTLRAPEGRGKHDDLLSALLLACDAETAAKLPPCGGLIICEHEPFAWDAASRQMFGGGARFFRRLPGGGRVPCSPPRGTWWHEQWARGLLAQGLTDPELIAFARTRGIDPDREPIDAERLFAGIHIPGEPIPRTAAARDAPEHAPEAHDDMIRRIARGE